MPLDYARDDSAELITVTTDGPLALADLLAVLDRQANDGTWGYKVLYDSRRSPSALSTSELSRLVLHAGKLTMTYGPRGPVALVSNDARFIRRGKVYASLAQLTALHVQLFDTLPAAMHWLEHEHARGPKLA